MATLDRLQPGVRRWGRSAAGAVTGVGRAVEGYVGRHRRLDQRRFTLRRLFYTARHRG